MDSSKNKEEDKSSSSQPTPAESSYLNSLSAIEQPINTLDIEDFFLFDELDDSPQFLITPPRFDLSPLKQLPEIESDIIGAKHLNEDLYNTKNPNLWSEEPTYVDEQGQIQYVELREANSFAEAVLEKQYCPDSPAQAIKRRRLHYKEAASSNDLILPLPEEPGIVLSSASSLIPPQSGPKSSGSGLLHLNSLLDALPLVHSGTTDKELEKGSESKRNSTKLRLVFSPNLYGQSTVHITKLRTADINVTSESPSIIIEPFTNSASVNDHIHNKAISPTNAEEFKQPGPDIDDDLKRCTCKRSACTKLYCDCFAAELYCAESCTCQGCLNRPEYKESVLNIREQIRSRNPFAFASKIVQDATNIPSNNMENDNLKAPSSTRHRNGCRCRKSKCVKNYCECFEIKVGCSSACRCKGCENSYGRKEGHDVAMEDAFSNEKDSDRVGKPPDLLNSEPDDNDVHGLSPLTPSLHCSDMRQSSVSVASISPVTPETMIPAVKSHTPQGISSCSSVLITPMSGLKEATTNRVP